MISLLITVGILMAFLVLTVLFCLFASFTISRHRVWLFAFGFALFIVGYVVHFPPQKESVSSPSERGAVVMDFGGMRIVSTPPVQRPQEKSAEGEFRRGLDEYIGAILNSLSSFFPSRGDYPKTEKVGYWLFHAVVMLYVVSVLLAVFGIECANWIRLLACRLSRRRMNVFWGYGEEADLLARAVSDKEHVAFALQGVKRAWFRLEKDSTVQRLISNGWKWLFLAYGDIPKFIANAERHFFFSPDGHANVTNAEAVIKSGSRSSKRKLYVRISALAEDDVLFKWAEKWNNDKDFDIEIFIVREEALVAHELLLRNPMLTCPGIKIEMDTATVGGEFNVLVIGFGIQGEKLLNDMICDAQFLDKSGKRVRLSADVVDRDSTSFGEYSVRCADAVARFNVVFEHFDVWSAEFWTWFEGRMTERPYNRVVVCLQDDRQNIKLGTALADVYISRGLSARNVIFCRIRDTKINQYVESTFEEDECIRKFVPFGALKTIYTFSNILRPQWEAGAIWLNGDYGNANNKPHDENMDADAWKRCSFFNKESTRASFFNQRNFLRLLGYRVDEKDSRNACFDANDMRIHLDILAKCEHLRWVAWHFVRGVKRWRPTKEDLEVIANQNGEKVKHNRIKELNAHADLVEFDELPAVDALFGTENTQNNDKRFVRSEAFRRSGLGIRKV